MPTRIYADYNATTPLAPEVLAAMLPYLREHYGNASSVHREGREARAAIDDARVRLAKILGAQETEIIFTAGGTEANNTAIFGVVRAASAVRGFAAGAQQAASRPTPLLTPHSRATAGLPVPHVVTSAIEHHAVLNACQYLENRGEATATYLPVNRECLVDPDDLRRAIRDDTVLVSIMAANNETGAVQPIQELAAACHDRGVPFHTDAVQSFGKVAVDVNNWGVDLLSISAHKIYGPKGAGLLYLRRGTKCNPLLVGGSHENDRRAGTENVAAIVGLAAAAERVLGPEPTTPIPNPSGGGEQTSDSLLGRGQGWVPVVSESSSPPPEGPGEDAVSGRLTRMESEQIRFYQLTERLALGIEKLIPHAHRNGHARLRIANTVNFSFGGCDEEGLLLGLDLEGIAVSSGSACAVGSLEPSHVLQAMGLPKDLARAAVRFSLGESNTESDIDTILEALPRVVSRLREFAG